jgi:hypothetical protein
VLAPKTGPRSPYCVILAHEVSGIKFPTVCAVQIKVLTRVQMGDLVRYLGSERILAGDATLAFLTRCIQVRALLKRSEAPWASSDQPNARGFSPNSLNKQASAAALCWAQNIKHVSANPQKTITIVRSREHSEPRPLGRMGFSSYHSVHRYLLEPKRGVNSFAPFKRHV